MFNLTWYNTLNQPALTPPAWIFPPVWAVLYLTIFVSFILFAFKKTNYSKAWGYILFFTQLFLNLCWTPVFFTFHNMSLALAIIGLMIVFVFWNIIEFIQVSKTSGLLLIPYFLWLIFAAYLNTGFMILN